MSARWWPDPGNRGQTVAGNFWNSGIALWKQSGKNHRGKAGADTICTKLWGAPGGDRRERGGHERGLEAVQAHLWPG